MEGDFDMNLFDEQGHSFGVPEGDVSDNRRRLPGYDETRAMAALHSRDWEPYPSVAEATPVGEDDPLADDEALDFSISNAGKLLPDTLWQHELYFGAALPVERDLISQAIETRPEHANVLKRWWKACEKLGNRRISQRRSKPIFGDEEVSRVIEDARKFALFMGSDVPTMTLQKCNRIVRVSRNSWNEFVPQNLENCRSKKSELRKGVKIYVDGRDRPIFRQPFDNHQGEIFAASAIIAYGKIHAIGPLGNEGTLIRTDREVPSVTITKIQPNFCRETVDLDRRSELFTRFEEASGFIASGSRSIFQIVIIVSDSMVTFSEPSSHWFQHQKLAFDEVNFDAFEAQLRTLVRHARTKVEEKLLTECFNFLGERQEELHDPERIAIVDAFYRLMKTEYTRDLQHGWERLSSWGLNSYVALSAVAEHYGVVIDDVFVSCYDTSDD